MKRLTPVMRRKLIPFLPKLIWHWRKMLRTRGRMTEDCPLCIASKRTRDGDVDCRRCPVFDTVLVEDGGPMCFEYIPSDAWDGGDGTKRVLDFLLRLQEKERTT